MRASCEKSVVLCPVGADEPWPDEDRPVRMGPRLVMALPCHVALGCGDEGCREGRHMTDIVRIVLRLKNPINTTISNFQSCL